MRSWVILLAPALGELRMLHAMLLNFPIVISDFSTVTTIFPRIK